MHNKSQAAIEFLSTYAWAFIALVVTIGALYYFGVFDFGRYLPQKCVFPSQFKCSDFRLQPSVVRVRLVNNIGEDICVKQDIKLTNDATTPITCDNPNIAPSSDCDDPSSEWKWEHATAKDLEFTNCKDGGYIPGEMVELKIPMKFYTLSTPTHPEHQINGKINGKVTS